MTDGALSGRQILVVEDDYLVAQILAEVIEAAGAVVLGPVGWPEEALRLLEHSGDTVDGAVLDVNLHGETSYGVADELTRRGIRFVFTTGYDRMTVNAAYRDHPRCEKPFSALALLTALTAA